MEFDGGSLRQFADVYVTNSYTGGDEPLPGDTVSVINPPPTP